MAHLFQVNLLLALLFLAVGTDTSPAAPKEPKTARIKVAGYGVLGNLELKRMLKTLELGLKKPQFLSASFVEDASLLLSSRVKGDGYLQPAITVKLQLADGRQLEVSGDSLLENPLPSSLQIKVARFEIHKGVLYYYEQLQIEGLTSIPVKDAQAYFLETSSLLRFKERRIYTPQKLQSGVANLTGALERKGFQDARVTATQLKRDDKTGAMAFRVNVEEGTNTIVQSVREEFYYEGILHSNETRIVFPRQPYSRTWVQDFVQSLRTNQFHLGYPDTKVELVTRQREARDGHIEADLLASVRSGRLVRVGEVEFEGQKKTRLSLISRRVRVKRGELLDPIRVEEGRYRLAQLGAFDTVDFTYRPLNDQTRDVTYHVKEGKTLGVDLLFGYGSYELLRGGVEIEERNILGLGHDARLKAVQSFKATSGEFIYTIPEFVGRDIDFFLNSSGLRREEISFTREEYGGGFGIHKFFRNQATDLTARYNYEVLNASEVFGYTATEGLTNANVGAIILDLKHDRRDNPLYPRTGYKVFANLESASEYFGGDVNYERLQISTSWHHPLSPGRTLSVGLSQGAVVTMGSTADNLPFNRRFFPGGQNSIRGYQEGAASPRNAAGQIVGAETFALATVEFEQALTPKWSVVLFSDSLGFAERIAQFPFDTGLFSVGGGLRWRTLIGPIRLEYGYNLNPRPSDPVGTLQFSLGFPF